MGSSAPEATAHFLAGRSLHDSRGRLADHLAVLPSHRMTHSPDCRSSSSLEH